MKAPDRAIQEWVGWLPVVLLVAMSWPSAFAQQRAPTQPGKEAGILLETGQTAYEQGRYDDALRAYNKAIVLSSSSPKTASLAHLRIGNVYMTQRKFDAAAASFQRAISFDPDYAIAHNNLGEALGELRQYNSALQAFSKAIALDPKLLRARYNTGITYERLGKLEYAEFVFRILIRDHPDYDLGYDALAVALSKSGRAKEAISFHEKAISLNPQEPTYHYDLALSYLILGDTPKAVEQQQKLQQLDPRMAERLASVIVKRQL
jgi:tetratricopeptide (TPR) repeat protein